MIVIDRETCATCGTCAEICHTQCMTVTDEKLGIERELCSTCGQCVAICPYGRAFLGRQRAARARHREDAGLRKLA